MDMRQMPESALHAFLGELPRGMDRTLIELFCGSQKLDPRPCSSRRLIIDEEWYFFWKEFGA
jgi:hypothetical protein